MKRILLAVVFAGLAVVCGLQYLASHAPGTPLSWTWFCGLGTLLCASAAVTTVIYKRT